VLVVVKLQDEKPQSEDSYDEEEEQKN